MIAGVAAGLLAGALWGLTYVAPLAVAPFGTVDLAIARYGVFGLASAGLMLAHPRFRPGPRHRAPRLILIGLSLGVIGYALFFLGAGFAVILAGPAIPPLIVGAVPVILAVLGNWRDRVVPWHVLAAPLSLVATGLLTVNLGTLAAATQAPSDVLGGTLCAFAALTVWVTYALINTRIMRAPDPPAALAWTGLQGIGAAFGVVCLLPFSDIWSGGPAANATDTTRFIVWVVLLGLAGSWIATWLWVEASRRLSLALSAQLIVAETVFGLVGGFIFYERWPSATEAVGATLQITGIVVAVAVFERARTRVPA